MAINLHQIKHFLKHALIAKRKGHGIHSPFAYQLCEEVFYNENSFYDFKPLQAIRNGLLLDETEITITDFGAGSKTFKSNTRKIKDIASKGISTQKQSELLYKLINFLKCRNALELGTSLGLNTLYLASANRQNTVTTIEGSEALFSFAKQLSQKYKLQNIRFINAAFDEVLQEIISSTDALDLLYVDGNHTYQATYEYFNTALKKKHSNSVFIFDDIYWSPGMTRAWNELKNHPDVTLSIDTFYFGMLFFRPEIKLKVDLRLYL